MPYIGNVPKYGDTIDNFKQLDSISSYTWTFDSSLASVINTTTNKFTLLSHRFVQGQRVTYSTGGGIAIGALTHNASYYIIRDDQNTFRLATSASNAASATEIDITSGGSGTSHTLNVAFDGVNKKFKPTWGDGAHSIRISDAAQLMISMNGVIQKPDITGVGGFTIDNGNISFAIAPDTSDVFWGNSIGDRISSFDISDNKVDNFTGTGSSTEFNLSRLCPTNQSLLVTIDGVVQHPTDNQGAKAYSIINGNVLTFTSAPSLGALIQARHIGFAGAVSGGGGVSSFNGRTGAISLQSGDPGVGVGIQSATAQIGYGITQINFVGTGNTFKYDSSTDTVDVSIEGGGGTSAGTRINYPDGTKSPFMLSMAHITQNMTLNDTTTGEDLDCNLVIAESQMVIDAGIGLTIGDGKKVLTDLYDIYQ